VGVARIELRVCVLVMAGPRLLVATPRHARHGVGLVLPEVVRNAAETPADAACRALWEQVGLFHAGALYPVATPFRSPRRAPSAPHGDTLHQRWQLFMAPPPEPLPEGYLHRGLHWRFTQAAPGELAPPFARAVLLAQGRLRASRSFAPRTRHSSAADAL